MSTAVEPTGVPPRRPGPYQTLEAWRGFAAAWVVLFHAVLTSAPSPGPWMLGRPDTAFMARGKLGVAIFFVISGYCIASAAVSARSRVGPVSSFLKARARRIYPPYYCSTALWIVALVVYSALVGGDAAGGHVTIRSDFLDRGPLYHLATLTLTQVPLGQYTYNIVLWSLCYEVAFYAIVAAALLASMRLGEAALLGALHALTLITLAWLNLDRASCPFPLDLWPQFGFGILVYRITTAPGDRWAVVVLALAAALTVAFARLPSGESFPDPSASSTLGFALAYALLLIALRRFDAPLERLPPVRWLAWVGTFSYSLYLTHITVQTVAGKVLRRVVTNPAYFRLQVLIELALAIGFARVFFAIGERPFLSARAPKPSRPEVVAAPAGTVPVAEGREG